ncbi:MAG TPA: TetR/AcrR family transcriptional regulator [Actinospica sp.]|nr:TetR/AcrR family transcriptional regulator [Actinospica sp.]
MARQSDPAGGATEQAGSLRAAASRVARTGADTAAPAVRPGVIPPPPWSRESGARKARADKPSLSREAIVAAAIRVVDEEGYDAVSMRRVAQEFGTGAASLYAYVANKDELMDLIVDEIMRESAMGEGQEPADDVVEWQEQIKEMVRSGYRTMTAHRDIAKAMLGRIPFGPNGLRAVENCLRLLRAHGMPDHVAAYAGDLIGQYIVGTAIEDYMWQERYPDATPEQVTEAMGEVGDYLESLPKEEFPNLTELARTMVGETGGPDAARFDRFELGLDILVRGLSTFLEPSVHERWR